MRIPKKISVSGYTLEIKYGNKVIVNGEECFGYYDPGKKTIALMKGMSSTRKKEIFLHEYIHFLEDIYRIKISEENIAALSLGILALINHSKVNLND